MYLHVYRNSWIRNNKNKIDKIHQLLLFYEILYKRKREGANMERWGEPAFEKG